MEFKRVMLGVLLSLHDNAVYRGILLESSILTFILKIGHAVQKQQLYTVFKMLKSVVNFMFSL